MGGEQLDPMQALARKGIAVQAPQPDVQMGGIMQGIAQPVVDDLMPLNAPGVMPVSGVPGMGATY